MKKKRLNPETNVEEEYEDENPVNIPDDEEEEDVTDRLTALEQSVDDIKHMVTGLTVATGKTETDAPEAHENKKPESPSVSINSPFDFIFVRKRGGRVVKRAVPKTEKKDA